MSLEDVTKAPVTALGLGRIRRFFFVSLCRGVPGPPVEFRSSWHSGRGVCSAVPMTFLRSVTQG